ncbi:hypothetical protein ACFLVX_05045 [Chloroflexota bacterium]
MNRLRRAGVLVFVGLVVIVYISLGLFYVQQGAKQKRLEEQINKINLVVARPLPSNEKLQADYEEAKLSTSPLSLQEALEIIVGIAEESGIDVAPGAEKLRIPSVSATAIRKEKIGAGTYQVLSFTNITVRGDYESVMAFVAALDSGETLKTMVLRRSAISEVEIVYEGEEMVRRNEYHDVSAAVIDLMTSNGISVIPNAKGYTDGTGINDMAAFPDATSAVTVDKVKDPDWTAYRDGDKDGFILYTHDKTADNAQAGLIKYVTMSETRYYYTCEADGTVRQFDGPDVAAATEYAYSEEQEVETVAVLNVDLYGSPPAQQPPGPAPKG